MEGVAALVERDRAGIVTGVAVGLSFGTLVALAVDVHILEIQIRMHKAIDVVVQMRPGSQAHIASQDRRLINFDLGLIGVIVLELVAVCAIKVDIGIGVLPQPNQ